MRRYLGWTIVGVILVLMLFGGALLRLYTDSIWFRNLGFAAIFSRLISIKLLLFLISAVAFFIIVYSNLLLARRIAPYPTERHLYIDEIRQRLAVYARRGLGALLAVGAIAISIIVGLASTAKWDETLRFIYGGRFGHTDPIFHKDLGFYAFQLPLIRSIYEFLMFALIVSTLAIIALYYLGQAIEFLGNIPRFAPKVKAHVFTLIALIFLVRAVGYWLDRYGLLQTANDLIPGPGYADIHGRLPALYALMAMCVLAAILTFANIPRRGIWLAAGGLIGILVVSIVVGAIYPAILQQLVVTPNQVNKERRFISYAIDSTRKAYGLEDMQVRTYSATGSLSSTDIQNNETTIQNVRLWDYDPLLRTYKQMQELQQFYEFQDVDIDRYTINGGYRQVMLSARELEQNTLPAQAQKWLSRQLVYTHGYGLAMSPVNEVSRDGLPIYFLKDIPVVSAVDVNVTQPRIYFGELTNNYALVNTKTKEFDYPSPGGNVTTEYRGNRGIPIGGYWMKTLFASRLADFTMLISGEITQDSRLLYRRTIGERVTNLFPFLRFDKDPYLVLSKGRMFWIQDAYTTSSELPYSQMTDRAFNYTSSMYPDVFNYIKNSVKITVDAYTGDVRAYYDGRDPVISAYARAFKGIFKPFSQMPAEVREHVRYPEDLFAIQTERYNLYHMTEPGEFFYKTDLWDVPSWESRDNPEGAGMEPYYVVMRLPGSKDEEFILLRPAVRANKDNMVAWICAKCDPKDYGRLVVYKFGQGQLVYGPKQIEARANQDATISRELSLWRQGGSTVIFGNLLAIPVENSVMYVQPLYLQSTVTGTSLPQFARVIVALGDQIAMEKSLQTAIADVIGAPAPPPSAAAAPSAAPTPAVPRPTTAPAAPAGDTRALIKQASDEFERAQKAQRSGDWATYGEELRKLERTLNQLQKAGGR